MKIINLLPKDKQRELYYEGIFRSLVVLAELSLITVAIVFAGQIFIKLYLEQQKSAIRGQIEELKNQSNRDDNAALKKRIGIINNEIGDFRTLMLTTPTWSHVLRAFSAQVPSGVVVATLQADLAKKRVDISGTSPTRDAVIALYNNISQDQDEFYNIDYPLENVSKPINVNFHFTFYIKDKLIQNSAP